MYILMIVGYSVSLCLLLAYYMHMFQLSSYVSKKYIHWMKNNKKKIAIQTLLMTMAILLFHIQKITTQVFSLACILFCMIYSVPKNKIKIPLKITNRVKRMVVTEVLCIILILGIKDIGKYMLLKLYILNVIAPILAWIANFINYPIEYLIRSKYIRQAKKIIQDMPQLIVIGITGSYGKTSVKNFLKDVLSEKFEVIVTPENYNTTMGVVKTIRENLKPTHQFFICEMGATKIGDIKEICDIVKPKLGIITAIGPQHLETFKTIDNIIKTKFELATAVKENHGVIFLNKNNTYIREQKLDMEVISYGTEDKSLNYNAYHINSSSKGICFNVLDKNNQERIFKTELVGKHNVVNLMAAIAVASYLEVPINYLETCVRNMRGVPHRLQLIHNKKFTIIDDSYNANPVSSRLALDTLSEFEGIKIIVTPGLIELGKEEKKYNFELGEYIASVCDYVVLVEGGQAQPILEGMLSKGFNRDKILIVDCVQKAISRIQQLDIKENKTILLENDLPDNYGIKMLVKD